MITNKVLRFFCLRRAFVFGRDDLVLKFQPTPKIERSINWLKNKWDDIIFWWYGIGVYNRSKDLSDKNANVKFQFFVNK